MFPDLASALAALAVVGLFLAILIASAQHARHIREHFPPISDAEFVARCTPGTNPDVALKVRRIVAEHFAIEYERVHPAMSFIEDIGAD